VPNENTNNDELKRIARNSRAHSQHLADIKRRLEELRSHLETLGGETKAHCRSVKVEGDRWYHPLLRSRPGESAYKQLLKQVDETGKWLDECARRRNAHDENVNTTRRTRWEKKYGKNPIALPGGRSSSRRISRGPVDAPRSVFDLEREESA
jgi:hypothetical protein